MSALSNRQILELERAVDRLKANYHYRLYMDGMNCDIGGPGSGNWGHQGRKGVRGGSAPGGGKQNRREIPDSNGKYTSWSKQRDAVAKPHTPTKAEIKQVPVGSRMIAKSGAVYVKGRDGRFRTESGHKADLADLTQPGTRIAIDSRTNPNIQKEIADFGGYMDRMEHAPRYKSQADVDAILRPVSAAVYPGLSAKQKSDLRSYTGSGFGPLNTAMRTGNMDTKQANRADRIAAAIDQTEMPQDMWLSRGTSKETAAKLLGISNSDIEAVVSGAIPASSLVGLKGTDKGFMSTGSTTGTGFSKGVALHIFAPKGTKGIYAEPFSALGNGPGMNWNGVDGQSYFSEEFETILQRNTSLQTCRAWVEGGQLHIECFVTGQEEN